MTKTVISIEHVSKSYQLGSIGTGTFRGDLKRWWAKRLRKPDPFAIIGETDHGNREGETLWALKDINFKVEQGEALGIIGRNGAGKSTLLKILSRVTAPTIGEIKVKGRIASLLEVGTGFHPELTGRENIFLNGAILGMSKQEIIKKFDEIVDFSGVERFIDTPVKRYSSGMYVRLAFAVAAHLEPEILIVDEVLAVGDAEFQKKCLGKMGDVAHEGRTVLFVSHNLGAIENLCKNAILLNSGSMINYGLVGNVIEEYQSVGFQLGRIDINDRKDREGNGKARVTKIRLLNENRSEIQEIQMGQSFIVQLETTGKLNRAIVGVLIGNHVRTQLTRGYTWEQVSQSFNLDGHDIIECHFFNIPLMHGVYHIHTWIGEQGDVCDFVENAFPLNINSSDLFGTGRPPDPTGGIAFTNAKWKINDIELN